MIDQDMPTKRIIIFTLSLLLIVFLSGCKTNNSESPIPTQEPIILGYCPTMSPYIQSLVESDLNLQTVQYENSVQAIEALKAGSVQAALIGRTARDYEIGEGIQLVRIEDGYTLITQTQAAIPYEMLPLVSILTLEENKDAAAILPPGTSITYYQDFDQMMVEMEGPSAVLLRWSELPANYQLLIPFDDQENKTPEFRSPHFYYDETLEKDFGKIIEALSSDM